MKILFVHQNFPGQYKHQARAFAADPANEVIALTMAPPVTIPGVRVIQHAWNRAQTTPHAYMADLDIQVQRGQSTAHAATQLKEGGFYPDLILAHPGWGESLFLKDVFPEAKMICYQEFYYNPTGSDINFDPEFPKASEQQIQQLRIRNANILINLTAADSNISPTAWQASQFPDLFKDRIHVLHDGIDTQRLRPDPSAWVQLMGNGRRFKKGDEVVTFVNRNFEPYRGFHTFMRAVPRILKARPNATIICVGADDVSYGPRLPEGKTWKEHYLAEVCEGIDPAALRFVGKLPYDSYLNLLQVSACHVYLTYPFVLSWSMLEAMSVGNVVVGSATQPVEEVIRDGENGILVDFFSPEQVADRVCEVLSAPHRYRFIRENARRTIIERYELNDICLPAQAQLYQDIVGKKLGFSL